MSCRANLEVKSTSELQKLLLHLQCSEQEWKSKLSGLDEQQKNREAEINRRLAELEQIKVEFIPLEGKWETLNKERAALNAELLAIQEKIARTSQDLEATSEMIAAKRLEQTRFEDSMGKAKALLESDMTRLPGLRRNLEELRSMITEVQTIYAEKRRSEETTVDELAEQQRQLLDFLNGQVEESPQALIDPAIPKPPPEPLSQHPSAEGLDTEDEDDDETVNSSGGINERLTPHGLKRHKSCKSRGPEGKGSSRNFRDELLAKMSAVRQVYRDQRKKSRLPGDQLMCIRHEGQWRVSEEDRIKYGLCGYQGTKNISQSFFVRIKQQVISQKMLNACLEVGKEDEVDALFVDPRDASDVYHKLVALFE